MSEKYSLEAVDDLIDRDLRKFASEWREFLAVQRKYSEHTLKSYKRDVENFFKFLNQHKGELVSIALLNSLKIADFRAWLASRTTDGLVARSNVRAVSSLKSLFAFLSEKHLVDMDAINLLRRPKIPKLLPKPIEEKTIINFLNAEYFFEGDLQWITNRDRALYYLLYCTGLRISEALNIKTKDVAPSMKIFGKGKKERIVLLLPVVIEKIKTYISTCPHDLNDGFLFVGLRGKKLLAPYVDARLEKLRLIYNLPDYASAHAFRHSFASHLIQNGADLRSVQDLLGHESLASTQIYTDINDYNILKIYENSHPLAKR